MPASPYSYAFILEHDYSAIRHWALTGELSDSLISLVPILRANEYLIKFWVRHNDAHWRMVLRHSSDRNVPYFVQGYAEFVETYELAEKAIQQAKQNGVSDTLLTSRSCHMDCILD